MTADVQALLDELVRRYARGEPLDVEAALARAGDRADELAPLIEAFLTRAPRRAPSPEAPPTSGPAPWSAPAMGPGAP